MDLKLRPDPGPHLKTEFWRHSLAGLAERGECFLDVDAKHLFDHLPYIDDLAADFLMFAAAVYGCDKGVPRATNNEDRWTRTIGIEIPVVEPAKWHAAAENLEECVGFLTGDVWRFSFVKAKRNPFSRRANRRTAPLGVMHSAKAVSLLSGGLDSFAGAIWYLENNPGEKLVIASHYDGKVAGPKSDQTEVLKVLEKHYPKRIQHLRMRVGLMKDRNYARGFETTFRSRSLVFLAIGAAVASAIESRPAILIPENGAIALNYPLTASRRGSCSTRTVHPHFIFLLRNALAKVGIEHPIENPFSKLTKGEVNSQVAATKAFRAGMPLTNSCAKPAHKRTWSDRSANACGRCIPCLFRRASLHLVKLDRQSYGIDVLNEYDSRTDMAPDFRSLIDLVGSNPSRREVMRGLVANGSIPPLELGTYADVVLRMIEEVQQWLRAKAPRKIRNLAGIR